jgi:hypothetical protein
LAQDGLRPDTGLVRGRLGAVLDGAGWSVGLAAALFVFALLYVVLDLQSPEIVLWTGHHVVATEQQGLATFRWQGQAYTVDVPGFGSGNKVDIYFSPGDPSGAMADNVPDRVFAGLLVGGPVIAGVAVLVAGLTRKRRWARRQRRQAASYGDGLDPDFVARQLKAYRRDQ